MKEMLEELKELVDLYNDVYDNKVSHYLEVVEWAKIRDPDFRPYLMLEDIKTQINGLNERFNRAIVDVVEEFYDE